MRTRLVYLLCLLLTLPTIGQAKLSDLRCDDSARMTQTLSDVIGAHRQGQGLRDRETIIEIWVTERTREFLIVQNYSNGTPCIVALGEHWEGNLIDQVQG